MKLQILEGYLYFFARSNDLLRSNLVFLLFQKLISSIHLKKNPYV